MNFANAASLLFSLVTTLAGSTGQQLPELAPVFETLCSQVSSCGLLPPKLTETQCVSAGEDELTQLRAQPACVALADKTEAFASCVSQLPCDVLGAHDSGKLDPSGSWDDTPCGDAAKALTKESMASAVQCLEPGGGTSGSESAAVPVP